VDNDDPFFPVITPANRHRRQWPGHPRACSSPWDGTRSLKENHMHLGPGAHHLLRRWRPRQRRPHLGARTSARGQHRL